MAVDPVITSAHPEPPFRAISSPEVKETATINLTRETEAGATTAGEPAPR